MDTASCLRLAAALLLAAAAAALALCATLLAAALAAAARRRRLLCHIPSAPPPRRATPWLLGDVPLFGPMSPPFRTAAHIAGLAAASPHPMLTYRF